METRLREEQIWLITCSLMILAFVAAAAGLIYARAVLVPFVLAIFIAMMVSPVIDLLVLRWRFPRWLAVAALLFLVLLLLAILGLALTSGVGAMVATYEEYNARFAELTDQFFEKLVEWNIHVDQTKIVGSLQAQIPSLVSQTAGVASGLSSKGMLIVIFVIFLVAGRNPQQVRTGIYAEIEAKTRKYLNTKFVLSAATGILVWIILALFGLPLAPLFGMLAFLLNFIPSIGSIIATLLPLPIAMMEYNSGWTVLAVVAVPGTVQMGIGNVLEPKLMGEGLSLHPVTILLALAFWGLLWGPVGMLLATPMTATTRIVLMRFVTTRPIGELLAGKLPEPEAGSPCARGSSSAPA